MLCQSLLFSKVTQFYTYIHSFFNIHLHYGLSQETGYSSLCYTLGPCCSSILNVIVCIYQPQIPSPSLPLPTPLATTSLISMSLLLSFVIRHSDFWWEAFHDPTEKSLQSRDSPRTGPEVLLWTQEMALQQQLVGSDGQRWG